MADLHGAPDSAATEPRDRFSARRARIGFALFIAYLVFYTGFVLLNAFAPNTIEMAQLAGVNLAVTYGLALIVVAFLLAVVYDIFSAMQER